MEAFDAECGGELKMDFRRFIKAIELTSQAKLLNRKNQLLLKQKLKDNWLQRSKIIPPSFPKFPASAASPRAPSATTHCILAKTASCERARSNWKLEFRRDELNILRYARTGEERQGEGRLRAKRGKRKFEEMKAEAHSLYRTNLSEEESCRERLKTTQYASATRMRYFA